MKPFKPLVPGSRPAFQPLVARDQVYDLLILESPGQLVIDVDSTVVAEYIPTTLELPFVIVNVGTPSLPLYVRDGDRRFALYPDAALPIVCPAYNGQLLSVNAIFEYWSVESQTIVVAELQVQISYRTQVTCCDATPAQWPTHLYIKQPRSYPIYFPL